VLGPLAAGVTADNLGAPTAYGLTAAACAAAVSVTALAARRTHAPARSWLRSDTPVRSVSLNFSERAVVRAQHNSGAVAGNTRLY
jgi:hypothetical protein